jgi:hypothetical protein
MHSSSLYIGLPYTYHKTLKSLPSAQTRVTSHTARPGSACETGNTTARLLSLLSPLFFTILKKIRIHSRGFRSGERGSHMLTSSPKTLSTERKIVCSVSRCTIWLKIGAGSLVISVVRMCVTSV